MPIISIKAGGISCSAKLEAGTYFSSSIELEYSLRKKHSLKVDIGRAGLLSMSSTEVIWTDSLGPCFPVVFLYENGDIGLYHSNNGGLRDADSKVKCNKVAKVMGAEN